MPLSKVKHEECGESKVDIANPAAVVTEVTIKPMVKQAMTKDDYWRRREERDLEKDKHIRLSGILQALLGSVNFGQYCTGTDRNAYLNDVQEAALKLAQFVTEKAA